MQPVLRREGFWLLRCRQAGGGERRPWGLRPPWSEAVGAGPVGAVRELGPRYVSEVEPTGLAEARLERRISWARTQRSEGPRAAGWPQTPWRAWDPGGPHRRAGTLSMCPGPSAAMQGPVF